jgi:hypothetical protein
VTNQYAGGPKPVVGSEQARATWRAGGQVLMQDVVLRDGRTAVLVRLPDDIHPASPTTAHAYQQPYMVARPPLLTPGQKWCVIGGALAAVLLLAVWLVVQALSAIGTVLAGAGSVLAALALLGAILLCAWLRDRSSGGGSKNVTIAAKKIGNIRF